MIRATGFALLLIAAPAAAAPAPAEIDTCFVPAERCADRIVAAIESARSEIRVQAYGFTSKPILAALASAGRRGVDVAVILDKSNDRTGAGGEDGERPARSRYSGATFMANAGVPVWIDYLPAIAHNKVIVVDRHLVVGGSFNYTTSADTRNAENVTFTESRDIAGRFLANWESRRAVSRSFAP